MKKTPYFILIVIIFSACTPQPAPTPAQTTPTLPELPQSAITAIGVAPTKTLAPTVTPLPTSTPDLSTIKADPEDLLLELKDLPIVGEYYLPKNGLSPNRNSEIIQRLGTEKGEAYIQETGRLDGWTVTYERGITIQTIPQVIIDNISMFETIEGAQISIALDIDNLSTNYREILSPTTLGDFSRGFSYTRSNTVSYIYYFSYRNYVHALEIRGTENEVTLSFVGDIANKLLEKLVIAQFTAEE